MNLNKHLSLAMIIIIQSCEYQPLITEIMLHCSVQ